MVNSEILKIATIRLYYIFLALSIFVLFRGHHQPGGGFIAGLLAGSSFILHALAFGIRETVKLRLMKPFLLMGTGLLLVVSSGLITPILDNGAFLEGFWIIISVFSFSLKAGTPLLFDTGVYLTVTGMLMLVISTIMEE